MIVSVSIYSKGQLHRIWDGLSVDAYRNSYGYQDGPFCFKYDKTEQDLVREY